MPFVRLVLVVAVLMAARVADAGASEAPAPQVHVSLRGVFDDTWEVGEPLQVMVRIEGGQRPVHLAPASGSWVDAVAVEMLNPNDGKVLARANPIGAPASPHAMLDPDRIAGGTWWFAEDAMQGLSPAKYAVRARLKIPSGTGWTGDAASEPVLLTLVEPSEATPRVSARTLSRAQLAIAHDDFAGAAALLDAVLAGTPEDFNLLCLRAEVALAGGNPIAARICLARAMRLLPARPPGPPPPVLVALQQRVLNAQLTTPTATTVPDWTWPPVSVASLASKDAVEEATARLPNRPPAVTPPASGRPGATSPRPAIAPTAGHASPASPANALPPANPPAPSAPAAPSTVPASAPATPLVPPPGVLVPGAELTDAAVTAEPAGQWATGATAGSQYGTAHAYSPKQATGAPNVRVAGNSPDAWCPAVPAKGMDWLEVTFATPVHATEVRVRQNDAAGAIVKVEAFAPDGTSHLWWDGVDPFQPGPVRKVVWFAVRVPATPYVVTRVKLTLNLASGPGYKQIDAVQLVGPAP